MPSDAALPSESTVPSGVDAQAPTETSESISAPEAQPNQPAAVQSFSLRKPSLLTVGELRRLRLRHDEFARSLATRLSIHLRLEIGVQAVSLDSCFYPQLLERLSNPTQVTVFRVESLEGAGLLEIPPKLAIGLVERLLGGPGKPAAMPRDLTEIEVALLDQIVDLILKEWCDCAATLPEAKAVIVGHETNPRFLQTAPSETSMLVLSLEFRVNESVEKIQLTLPYPMLEPVLRRLNPPLEIKKQSPPPKRTAVKWNPTLDSVRIPLSVQWKGLEIDARKLAHLRVGDVLPVASERLERAAICLASVPKFNGRLGKCGQTWAVQLTEKI